MSVARKAIFFPCSSFAISPPLGVSGGLAFPLGAAE
jgi:hypothetical protein